MKLIRGMLLVTGCLFVACGPAESGEERSDVAVGVEAEPASALEGAGVEGDGEVATHEQALSCGLSRVLADAYYRNCGNGTVSVMVDMVASPDYRICVGPGQSKRIALRVQVRGVYGLRSGC